MRVVYMLPLVVIPLLAGCTMPRPWRMPKLTQCVQSGPPPATDTLFMTLRQPDCGKRMLTRYRGDELRFGAAAGRGPAILYSQDDWLKALEARVLDPANRPPVIFIHGYNNTQEEAIERAERIAAALRGQRAVIALTWPSYGKKTGYFWDEANAEWALEPASATISAIAEKYPGTTIIAHSMGSRLALRAVADLKSGNKLGKLRRLILASPDVDRDALARSWNTGGPPLPVTMYVSLRDQPLSGSWRGHAYPRAGDSSYWVSGRQPVFPFAWMRGLEVVDTTKVDATILGHSAFIDVPEGALDLCRVIQGIKPEDRGLERRPEADNYFRLTGKGPIDSCRPQ